MRKLFGTVLTVTFALLTAYVAFRAWSVPWLGRPRPARFFFAGGAGFVVIFVLARFVGRRSESAAAVALETVGMVLLGTVFLTAVCMLLADLVTLFGWAFRRWVPWFRIGGLVAGVLLSIVALVQASRAPAVVSYEVTMPGLPGALDGTVLIAVTDAHVGGQLGPAWMTARIEEIQAQQPDLVVFVGDMFDGHGDDPVRVPALRQLSAPRGKWFVVGNHEMNRDGTVDTGAMDDGGFRRLAGGWTQLAPGLVLAGVDDLTRLRRCNDTSDPVGRALAGRPPGATVLLSHSPLEMDRAASEGVGLMICGHTHGGQVWPFGYLVQTRYPLLAGRYEVDGMTVIVSRGVGTWGPRMRLWHRGEIVRITLRAKARR